MPDTCVCPCARVLVCLCVTFSWCPIAGDCHNGRDGCRCPPFSCHMFCYFSFFSSPFFCNPFVWSQAISALISLACPICLASAKFITRLRRRRRRLLSLTMNATIVQEAVVAALMQLMLPLTGFPKEIEKKGWRERDRRSSERLQQMVDRRKDSKAM